MVVRAGMGSYQKVISGTNLKISVFFEPLTSTNTGRADGGGVHSNDYKYITENMWGKF